MYRYIFLYIYYLFFNNCYYKSHNCLQETGLQYFIAAEGMQVRNSQSQELSQTCVGQALSALSYSLQSQNHRIVGVEPQEGSYPVFP